MLDITKLVEILTTYDDTQVDPVPHVETWDWRMFDPPKFEILPREYLSYAEGEIDRDSVVSRINCIGHLKRALECQVDIFLHVWVHHNDSRWVRG